MRKTEVMALLRANQDERGIRHWNERCAKDSNLKSFGIGLTKLRKMARQIGRDHDLAAQLWKSDVYEARIIALLVDDPKVITRQQVEQQVEQLDGGHLAHVFSSCDAPLSKTPFVRELADSWMNSKDAVRRRCGFGLLYEMSTSRKKNAPDEARLVRVDLAEQRRAFDRGEVREFRRAAFAGEGVESGESAGDEWYRVAEARRHVVPEPKAPGAGERRVAGRNRFVEHCAESRLR